MSETWVVTGASRGIGLELVKELLTQGHQVIGACRNPDGARDLWEIKSDYKNRFRYVKLDVSSADSVAEFGAGLKNDTIDVLVNNAGILKGAGESLDGLDIESVLKSIQVNTIGPIRVTQILMPCLKRAKSPKVVNVTSLMGSIADNGSGGYYGYRMSKAALNMFGSCLSKEFPNITTLQMHPGWVKTDMGGAQAPTEREDSVRGMIDVIKGATIKDSGRFLDFRGKELPW
jgi:NAD(P)-dependent dehydrogenase (short-subunit alcohol dehydrogenase family)